MSANGKRRGSRLARLAALEERAGREASGPRTLVCLPRKDGDDTPLGVAWRSGNVLAVLYHPDEPFPELPAGWRD